MFLLPPSGPRAVAYNAISLGMVVAVVIGTRRWRPARPMAWYLIAAGLFLFSIGDVDSFLHQWTLTTEGPFLSSLADGFHLAFYPVLASGLLLLVPGRIPGRDGASLIDATIVTTGVGLLLWAFLIGPYVRLPDLGLPQRLVSIAYPLGDLLLLAVALRLWRAGSGALASRLLAVGVVALLAVDTVHGLGVLNGDRQLGGPVDAGRLLYPVAFGLAALDPSMVSLSEPAPVDPRLTRTRLGLLAGASLMAPAMLVIQALRDQPIDVGVIAGGSVVLFLLTLARMGGLASEVASQTERRGAMGTVLRAAEQERVRLAADLHDGPVQELTALRYGLTRARDRIQRGQPEQAEGLLAELEDELAAGITGLRRVMAELRPAVLDEQGLEMALHNQVRAFEATSGVACAISAHLHGRLEPDLETVLYRVTQETLNNVGKHAHASRVTVSLAAENGSVRLRINDDGVGFDPVAAARLLSEGHFGLAGMRERVELAGGHLSIESGPGKGTTVAVRWPTAAAGKRPPAG
jgi:signal transduction histidine kinase